MDKVDRIERWLMLEFWAVAIAILGGCGLWLALVMWRSP